MAAAANHTWLQHARIEVLVRCEPGGLDQPQHCPGAIEIGWWFTKDFCSWVAFKGEAERKSEAVAKALEGGRQNIMFWCNDGHLRSPAALACFLLWTAEQDADLLMSRIAFKRERVQPDARPCCQEGLLAGL